MTWVLKTALAVLALALLSAAFEVTGVTDHIVNFYGGHR
jgi:hypothetical protein